MEKIVLRTIKKHKMFNEGDKIVVALSGGADSVALVMLLVTLREKMKLTLFALHVNHGLRGQAAETDEQFVWELCKKQDIPLRVVKADVRAEAQRRLLSIEEAGRRVRYDAFFDALAQLDAQKIATGHNRDDNAETVLLNLARGAGLGGLCGIPPVNGYIIRPLIETPRSEIEAYLMKERIPFITDASNKSPEYTRNRVRHTVLPALEKNINPNAKKVIARNTDLLRADLTYLEEAAREAYLRVAQPADTLNDPVVLNIPALSALPQALQNRVVREAITRTRHLYMGDLPDSADGVDCNDIHGGHIASALDIAVGTTGRAASLPGVTVRRAYHALHFEPSATPAENGFFYPLAVEKSVFIPQMNKTITCSFFSPPKNLPFCCTHSVNYDILLPNLSDFALRTRRKGDRITLKRKDGTFFTKKIQDYFTDEKIPRPQRNTIPLVATGQEILWILTADKRKNATPQAGTLIYIYFTEENQ